MLWVTLLLKMIGYFVVVAVVAFFFFFCLSRPITTCRRFLTVIEDHRRPELTNIPFANNDDATIAIIQNLYH